MSWADLAIIILVAFFFLVGLLKGTQKTLLSIVTFLIAAAVAFFMANVVAETLLNVNAIKNFVVGDGSFSLYTWINKGFNRDGSSSFLILNHFEPIEKVIEQIKIDMTGVNATAMYEAFQVFSVIIGVGLFIVVRLLLSIVTMIIKSFIPKKKSIGNRTLGAFLGIIRGAVWAFAITLVFSGLGGFAFNNALSKVEAEYENSVMSKYVLEYAYKTRNAVGNPDKDMFGRIVTVSGLTVKEDDTNTDPKKENRESLAQSIINLNYASGAPTVDFTSWTVTDGEAIKLTASDYTVSGFNEAILAITEYNTKMFAAIQNGVLNNSSLTEIVGYKDNADAIYQIMYGGGESGNLVTKLTNYQTEIAKAATPMEDEELIATYNATLKSYYDSIVSDLNAIKAKYDSFTTLAANESVGSLTLPDMPVAFEYGKDIPSSGESE